MSFAKSGLTCASLVGIAVSLLGCTGGVESGTTLADSLQQLTADAKSSSALDQLADEDIVAGYQQFAGRFHAAGLETSPAALTDEQISQIEALKAQLDDGQIDRAEFAGLANEIIGDAAPGVAFAGSGLFGGPFGHGPAGRLAELLGMTEEQQASAMEIADLRESDIRALRDAAREQIRAILTDEQIAILDEKVAALPEAAEPSRLGVVRPAPGTRPLELVRNRFAEAEPTEIQPDSPPRRAPGRPGSDAAAGDRLERLTAALGLSQEQSDTIDAIRVDLRAAVEARHQQARDEFRAILTVEQLAALDEFEASRPAHPGDQSSD